MVGAHRGHSGGAGTAVGITSATNRDYELNTTERS
jgi:hypothetical protein